MQEFLLIFYQDKQVSRVKEFLSTVVVPTFKPASKVCLEIIVEITLLKLLY